MHTNKCFYCKHSIVNLDKRIYCHIEKDSPLAIIDEKISREKTPRWLMELYIEACEEHNWFEAKHPQSYNFWAKLSESQK